MDRSKKRSRKWLIGLGAVLVLIVLAVVFAPTIVGPMARGWVAGSVDREIPGSVRVSGLSLGWFGPQRVSGAELIDTDGSVIATVDLRVSAGLLALATGSRDLGVVNVSGDARVVRGEDGVTNVERALGLDGEPKPGAGRPGEPVNLPGGLEGRLVMDDLTVTYADPALASATDGRASEVVLDEVTGDIAFAVGGPMRGELSMRVREAGGDAQVGAGAGAGSGAGARVGASPGRATLTADITGLTAESGELTPEAANYDVSLIAEGLPLALADALAGMEGSLVRAVGPELGSELTVKGGVSDLTIELAASASNLDIDFGAAVRDGALVATRAGHVSMDVRPVVEAFPQVREAIETSDEVRIEQWPRASIGIDALTVPLKDGFTPELGGASGRIVLAVSEIRGRATLPELGESEYHVDPIEIRAESGALSQGLTVQGGTRATLGGRDAGEVTVDLTVLDLVDETGGLSTSRGDVTGRVALSRFATSILEPIGAAIGADLEREVGPELTLSIDVRRGDEGLSIAELAVESENVQVDAEASIAASVGELIGAARAGEGDAVRGRATLAMASIGPTASRYLEDAGVTIDPGSGMAIQVEDLVLDMGRLRAEEGVDLRGLTALVTAEVAALTGQVALPGEGEARPLRLSASTVVVDVTEPASAGLRVSSEASVGGEAAGRVSAELTAGGFLDDSGRLVAGLPGSLRGQARVEDVSTALVQSIVASLNEGGVPLELDLPSDVGPSVTVTLNASQVATGDSPGRDEPGRQALALNVSAESLSADASLISDGQSVAVTGEGLGVRWSAPGRALSRLIPEGSPVTLQPSGALALRTTDLSIPLVGEQDGPKRPDLAALAGSIDVTATGMGVQRMDGQGAPLALSELGSLLRFDGAGGVVARTTGDLRRGEQPFTLASTIALASLFGEDRHVSSGSVSLRGAPVAVAELGMPQDIAEARETIGLITALVGPVVGATISGASEGPGAPLTLEAEVGGGRATSRLAGSLAADRLTIASATVDSRITPGSFQQLLTRLAPEQAGRVRLIEETELRLDAESITAPLGEAGLEEAGPLRVTLRSPGQTMLEFTIGEGESRRVERSGVSDLALALAAPGDALLGGGSGRATGELTGNLVDGEGAQVGSVSADLFATLAGGRLAGEVGAEVRAERASTLWAGLLAGYGDELARALGDTFDLAITGDAQIAEAEGEVVAREGSLSASLNTPLLEMAEPVSLALTEDRISAGATRVTWAMPPGWINAMMTPEGGEAAAMFAAPARISLDLRSLTLARGEGGLLRSGVFALDAGVTAPTIELDARGQSIILRDVNLTATEEATERGSVIALVIEATEEGREPVTGFGRILGLAGPSGQATPEAVALDATLEIPALSTAIVDALARQGGFLVDMLGPTLSGKVALTRVGETGGTANVSLTSERAEMNLSGQINENRVFVAGGPVTFTLTEITPEFGSRLTKGIPLATEVEKREEDGPATVTLRGLTLPLDGDLSSLNMEGVADIGTARFSTGPAFSALLDVTGQRAGGKFGRKLQPFDFTFKDGVMAYDRYVLPIGEFEFDIAGKVDFVNRTLDIITFVPVGAMSDTAAGQLNTGLGGLLGEVFPNVESLTKVPWRTTGEFSDPRTRPDVDLMLENTGRQLLRPDKLIERRLKSLFEGIGGGG